jgi:hypothetical protein
MEYTRAQPGPLLSADFVTVRPLDQTQIIVQVPNVVLEGFALGDGFIPYAEAGS